MSVKTKREIGLETHASESKPAFRRILLALDGSESSGRASKVALELAEKFEAELIVLHAISPPSAPYPSTFASSSPVLPPIPQSEIDAYYAYAKRVALGIVGETVAEAKRRGVIAKSELPEGVSSVVETIINHATREDVDLIVIGTRGLGGFKKLLLGSVSNGVVTHASCPVLIVR